MAVPPDHVARSVVTALRDTDAVVTDVGSVKGAPLQDVAAAVDPSVSANRRESPDGRQRALRPTRRQRGDPRGSALGGHSRAGRRPVAVAAVEALVELCGALPVRMTPEEHDRAVARLPPAAPAPLGAGGRAARRRPSGAPGSERSGRPRRDPGRRERPGAVAARS
ncbi:MAG: hypothetical protein R2734_01675 [Nocardioides sp.]